VKTLRMRVKSWEEISNTPKISKIGFLQEMIKYCGNVIEVEKCYIDEYRMVDDGWYFRYEWLEEINNDDLIEEMNYLLLGILSEREL